MRSLRDSRCVARVVREHVRELTYCCALAMAVFARSLCRREVVCGTMAAHIPRQCVCSAAICAMHSVMCLCVSVRNHFNLGVSISVNVSCQHAQAHQWFTTPSHNALVECTPVTSRRSIAVHLSCACQSGSRPCRPPACSQHSGHSNWCNFCSAQEYLAVTGHSGLRRA